jgi:hypothetical protein
MHQTGAPGRVLTRLHFGFSATHLFIRLDGERPLTDLLTQGYAFSLLFLHPTRQRLDIHPSGSASWSVRKGAGIRVAAGTVLEVAIPLDDLDAIPDQPLETDRYPASRPIQLAVPGPAFSGNNWRA